ncbi:MAG TPA: response regulator transcription factor [Candidatus Paceibacterota bacterium]|nr:response regulator transcription factor [Candidatus Paceibacterota bacterium]
MRILIIEDNPRLGRTLKASLESESYAVDIESDGEKGLYRARTNDYDAIVLDDILPGRRGYEICRELRSAGRTAPILLMSVQSEVDRKVSLLNDGADDYLAKPFSYAEMSARLRALLRRPHELVPDRLSFGDLVLDENSSTVTRGGKASYLTAKEFSLLQYLVRNAGHLVTRAMLFEHVWDGETDPVSNMLETHIHNLRRKVERPGLPGLIHTVPGRGYVFR